MRTLAADRWRWRVNARPRWRELVAPVSAALRNGHTPVCGVRAVRVIVQHAAAPLSRHCANGVARDGNGATPLCRCRCILVLVCREGPVELQKQARAFTRVVDELHALTAGVGAEASVAVAIRVVVSVTLRRGGIAAVALWEVSRAAPAIFQVPHAGVLAWPPPDVISNHNVGLTTDWIRLHVRRDWPEAVWIVTGIVHLTLLDQEIVVASV